MTYTLWILIMFSFGDPDAVILKGTTQLDLEACKQQGDQTVNWLTQDFIKVVYECIPQK